MQLEEEIKDRFGFKRLDLFLTNPDDENNKYFAYETDSSKIYVHLCKKFLAWPKFEHEINSLNEIRKTYTVYAPKVLGMLSDTDSNGAVLVTEFLPVAPPADWKAIGKEVAELHYSNYVRNKRQTKLNSWVGRKIVGREEEEESKKKGDDEDEEEKAEEEDEAITEFGFIDPTIPSFYGNNEFVNVWHDDWPEFFGRHRLEPQFRRVIAHYADRQVLELWSDLQLKLDDFFVDIPDIVPSLLHGDLNRDRIGTFKRTITVQNEDGEEEEKEEDKCILLEPNSFYGHSEFDFAQLKFTEDLPVEFYEEYFKKNKKQDGFEARSKLYQLFFALNDYTKNEDVIKSLMKSLVGN